jgi:hypothetical protein
VATVDLILGMMAATATALLLALIARDAVGMPSAWFVKTRCGGVDRNSTSSITGPSFCSRSPCGGVDRNLVEDDQLVVE